jgi:hypothetical protein
MMLDQIPDDERDENNTPLPDLIIVNCPICMAELTRYSDVEEAYCPTCDMWVEAD